MTERFPIYAIDFRFFPSLIDLGQDLAHPEPEPP